MTEKAKKQEVTDVRFDSVQDALDAYVNALEAYASDPSDLTAMAVLELKDEIDGQYESEDGYNAFEEAWAFEASKGDGNRFELADPIEEQINAEASGGTYSDDPDYWDHESYEEYHDSF